MTTIWRTVLSTEARNDILDRPLITSSGTQGTLGYKYEVHECGCTVILDEGAFVLCPYHLGFEEGVLAVSGRKWGRRR